MSRDGSCISEKKIGFRYEKWLQRSKENWGDASSWTNNNIFAIAIVFMQYHTAGLCVGIILTKVQESFPLKEREWIIKCASDTLYLLAPTHNKPSVALINHVHVSLTDTWWLKQCMIKKSCLVHLECTQLNKPHLVQDINDMHQQLLHPCQKEQRAEKRK